MFIHNFKYAFKTLFRSRALIFWTFAFPIILGTFFNMAFSNIENSEKLNIINIAIIDNDDFQNDEILKKSFEELSSEDNENRIFNTKYVNKDLAKEMLENSEIIGYLEIIDEAPNIVISTNGINETIFKYVTEEIVQSKEVVDDIAKIQIEEEFKNGNMNIDYVKIYKNVFELIQNQNVEIKNISNGNLSYTMIEFYTLIAMACLYGGMLGMVAINNQLPNMSNKGKRVGVSPINKMKTIFSSLCASYVVQLIGLALLFLYTIFVLKVNYGDNLLLIVLLGMIGSLAGLALGLAIGSVLKTNDATKTGILLAVTMLGCFLSGMMGITMKYVVDTNIPIINKINPANMITDGFYALYYYDTLDRFFFNIISLLVFSGIMVVLSYISLRRQKYDSI